MANETDVEPFTSVRRTQFGLPGTAISFEFNKYEATGSALPRLIRPPRKRISRLAKSPFIITAKETESYREKMAQMRVESDFTFQQEMHLSEDLKAIQQRSRLSSVLRDHDQYEQIIKLKDKEEAHAKPHLSHIEDKKADHPSTKAPPLTMSKDPLVATVAHYTMPLKPNSITISLPLSLTDSSLHLGSSKTPLGASKQPTPMVEVKTDVSSSQSDISSSTLQKGAKKTIQIGDTAVPISDIIEDTQQVKAAQLVSPTIVFSQQLRTPDQLVDLNLLCYDHNTVRQHIKNINGKNAEISKLLSKDFKERRESRDLRELEPLSVVGSSVLSNERQHDAILKHNKEKSKRIIKLFNQQLKNELQGWAKSGTAAQLGEHMYYSLTQTISSEEMQQSIADKCIEELEPEKPLDKVPVMRPLPCTSHSLAVISQKLVTKKNHTARTNLLKL